MLRNSCRLVAYCLGCSNGSSSLSSGRWCCCGDSLSVGVFFRTCCYCLLLFFIIFSALSVCLSLVNEPSWPQPFLIIGGPAVQCVCTPVCVCACACDKIFRASGEKNKNDDNNNIIITKIIRPPPNLQRHVAHRHRSGRPSFYIVRTGYLLVFFYSNLFFLLFQFFEKLALYEI